MTNKTFKGTIFNCRKFEHQTDSFGPNLGYLYLCDFQDHPQFGLSFGGHTSLVVREYTEDEKNYVETLNSLYIKED